MIQNMTTNEKRHHLTLFKTALMDRVKSGFEVDSIAEFAVEFIKVWGRTEARRQIRAMVRDTEESKRFCIIVSGLINE